MGFDAATDTTYVARTAEIAIEVGDSKQTEFFPQAKFSRWNNETNVSLRLANVDEATVRLESDKVVWATAKLDARFYELDDGFEFALNLFERPDSNALTFTLSTKGLVFYYQRPLANLAKDGSTWEEKPEGGRVFRPAHMSGGYVAFHAEKAGDFSLVGGANYRSGRAFEIHRPWAEDSDGTRVWCDLEIDTQRDLLFISVPQEFLDAAVYPVLVDPTIGYSSIGASADTNPSGKFVAYTNGAGSQTDGTGGTLSVLKLACDDPLGQHVKIAVYPNVGTAPPSVGGSPAAQSLVSGSSTGSLTITRTTKPTVDADWTSGSVSATLAPTTYYWICIGVDNASEETNVYFDSASSFSVLRADGVTYASFPPATAPATFSVNDSRAFSAYGVYSSDTLMGQVWM